MAVLGSRAWAEEALKGDELPLNTTGLEHLGMVVPDVEAAARFYSSVFNPDMQKEKDAPLRYYVMTGSGYIAIGSRAGVTELEDRSLPHAGSRLRPRAHEQHARRPRRSRAVARGVVPDPDGIGLQLIAVPGGPGPTAVPGGRLVEVEPLVKPDRLRQHPAEGRRTLQRSSDFYSHFFKTTRAPEKGQVAFVAADTHIVLRPVAAGESPAWSATRCASPFDRAKVLKGSPRWAPRPEAKGRRASCGSAIPMGLPSSSKPSDEATHDLFFGTSESRARTIPAGHGVRLSLPLLESHGFRRHGRRAGRRGSTAAGLLLRSARSGTAGVSGLLQGSARSSSSPTLKPLEPFRQSAHCSQRSRAAAGLHRRRLRGSQSLQFLRGIPERRPDAQEHEPARHHGRSGGRKHRPRVVSLRIARDRHRVGVQLLR